MKIDDVEKTLDADGKLVMEQVDFDTELALLTELEGYVKDEQTVTILAKDNKVDINLVKAKVRQSISFSFLVSLSNLFSLVQA